MKAQPPTGQAKKKALLIKVETDQMLEYNEITLRKFIIFENEPYEVLDSHVFRKQQRKPVNATKLKSLLNGRIVEHSFHSNDKVEEAEIDSKTVKFLYANKGEFWFCDTKDPSKRFTLPESLLGDSAKFIKPNSEIETKIYDEKIIGVKLPIKVELKVKESAPGVKGDSAKGGMKQATLETGAVINVPLFINEGDILRINTDTGEYVERVS
ncbi:MAG: Elongation factor P [Parcubacteria group bacterium GW2011_GWF2_38_76]|nr:MAG: Elongation factor P [Parcubacteria group bacterium GW2011_GWF2_38_76]HBM45878.1 elongation factor P [Patescibacteria group bacterium]